MIFQYKFKVCKHFLLVINRFVDIIMFTSNIIIYIWYKVFIIFCNMFIEGILFVLELSRQNNDNVILLLNPNHFYTFIYIIICIDKSHINY